MYNCELVKKQTSHSPEFHISSYERHHRLKFFEMKLLDPHEKIVDIVHSLCQDLHHVRDMIDYQVNDNRKTYSA